MKMSNSKKRLKIFLMINIIIGIVFAITKKYIYLNYGAFIQYG